MVFSNKYPKNPRYYTCTTTVCNFVNKFDFPVGIANEDYLVNPKTPLIIIIIN